MVRISYNFDGRIFTEIINARRNKVTKEMLNAISSVYIFGKNRTITGKLAKRYIRKLQHNYL